MKHIFKILILMLIVIVSMSLVGCKSGGDVEEDEKVDEKVAALDLPDWFLSPPIATDALYAAGFSKKSNPQMALTTAADWARQELARVISVKVSTLTKQFLEEAGVGDVTQATEFSQVVSKSLASNTISGSKIEKQELKAAGNKYAAYVLVRLAMEDMGGKIDEIVKANAAAYAKLQANKAFDDLAEELKAVDTSAYEKPATPDYE